MRAVAGVAVRHTYAAFIPLFAGVLLSCGGRASPTSSTPISYVAGQSYLGRNGYIEYVAGNAPVILTAPHGGSLTPGGIPDRTASACGGAATTVTDTNTGELVRAMHQRLELGYLVAATDLNRTDSTLDAATTYENTASIRTLSQFSPLSFSALVRGPNSLGTLYSNNGFPSVPSATDPSPNGTDYFNGGANTVRHSCGSCAAALGGSTNGNICGVQIESHFSGVRDNASNRNRFGDATAIVLEEYLRVHWGLRLAPP